MKLWLLFIVLLMITFIFFRYDQEKAKKVDLSVENDVLKGAVIELEAKLLEVTHLHMFFYVYS